MILDALRTGPRHGYDLIKSLEERSGGRYSPGPGTIYPTLQFLEEAGFVHGEQEGDRKVFRLTPEGEAELGRRQAQVDEFWLRFGQPVAAAGCERELEFLRQSLGELHRTVMESSRELRGGPAEKIRQIRRAVETCQSQVRDLLC